MLLAPNERALVYQVLDEVLAGTAVPVDARSVIFSVVDRLRDNSPHAHDLRRAECVSVELHKLEWALQRADQEAAMLARRKLKNIAVELLNSRICTPH